MRNCEVCGVEAKQHCGGCGNVSYCGVEHQKKNWARHKPTCFPFKVCSEEGLGEYLIAGRNLQAGDLVLYEEVSVQGPPSGESVQGPLCLGCYFPASLYRCTRCSAPLCGPSCEKQSYHNQECSTLEEYGVGKLLQDNLNLYGLITPLRFLLLRDASKEKFRKCISLSTNLESRVGQPHFQQYLDKARNYSEILQGLVTEEEMLKILTILDTNTFQVLAQGSGENLSGLYPRVSKLNHSCVPNARTIFCSDYSIKVICTVPIKKGETIYISYLPPFYNTFARQTILEKGKQFICRCPRCQDPTELRTMLSGYRCGDCRVGWISRGQSAEEVKYTCSSCNHLEDNETASNVQRTLFSVQTNLNKENIEELEGVLYKYSDILHPNHALLTEARQHLAAALGRVDGHRYDQLDREHLQLKVDLSLKLLDIISVVEPGISKSRGITLLDLTECQSRLAVMYSKTDGELLENFCRIEKLLEECSKILSYEDDKSIEGNVSKQSRQQLETLRLTIKDLKKRRIQ